MTDFRSRPTSISVPPQRIDVTTAATVDPLTLDDAKDWARIDTDDDDSTVRRLIKSSTNRLEAVTGRRFINTTLTAYFDGFPTSDRDWLELRVLPVSSVSSIKYLAASDGTETTWSSSNYSVDNKSENMPVRITPVFSESYPTARDVPNSVYVEFVCGYGAADTNVPDDIRHTIAAMVSHYYTNRELTAPVRMSSFLQDMIDKIRWDAP